jgi:hypothetical protein
MNIEFFQLRIEKYFHQAPSFLFIFIALSSRSWLLALRISLLVLPVLAWAMNWIIGQYRHPVLFLSPGAGSGQS